MKERESYTNHLEDLVGLAAADLTNFKKKKNK